VQRAGRLRHRCCWVARGVSAAQEATAFRRGLPVERPAAQGRPRRWRAWSPARRLGSGRPERRGLPGRGPSSWRLRASRLRLPMRGGCQPPARRCAGAPVQGGRPVPRRAPAGAAAPSVQAGRAGFSGFGEPLALGPGLVCTRVHWMGWDGCAFRPSFGERGREYYPMGTFMQYPLGN
jgi:hypothetical protein